VCDEYVIGAYVMAVVTLVLPLAFITYIMHRGVHHHAVWVPAEGHFFSRFYDLLMEQRDTWFKWCGYGFKTAVESAWADAVVRGEWKVSCLAPKCAWMLGMCECMGLYEGRVGSSCIVMHVTVWK
jgi:hypothetical protein